MRYMAPFIAALLVIVPITSYDFFQVEADGLGIERNSEGINFISDMENGENEDLMEISSQLQSNYFIQNVGQIPEMGHKFYSTDGNIQFLNDEVLMRFREMEPIFSDDEEPDHFHDPMIEEAQTSYHDRGVVLKYYFINANHVEPYGRERCSWNTNYFKGSDPDHWHTEVPNYREIVYPEIWDGIDVVYKLLDGNVKYDIVISPGADTDQIMFGLEGNEELDIDENGDLVIVTEYWDIMDSGLVCYYSDSDGETINVRFNVIDQGHFGFDIKAYDRSREVVIDPLTYSTFLGGSDYDSGSGIAIDSSGNAYVTGSTNDGTTDYPTTTGAYNTTHNGGNDVFVIKLNSSGSSLIYSTFIGGSIAFRLRVPPLW